MAALGRFARLPRWAARGVLALLAALMLWGALGAAPSTRMGIDRRMLDSELYRAISARVGKGENYYAAAIDEQRTRGYPLKPFVTVRPPTLAVATAAVGGEARLAWILRILVLVTMIALVFRIFRTVADRPVRIGAIALAVVTLSIVAQPEFVIWHEAWAATLVALSLALRRPGAWGPSLAAGLLAVLFRELALPWLAVMAFAAFAERRRSEGLAWIAAITVALLALAVHAAMVQALVLPGDVKSPGWGGMGGWPLVVNMVERCSAFGLIPHALAVVLLPLALFGWAGQGNALATRAALWLCGTAALFMVAGRSDNFYWGIMFASLTPIGLAFAPRALADAMRAARWTWAGRSGRDGACRASASS